MPDSVPYMTFSPPEPVPVPPVVQPFSGGNVEAVFPAAFGAPQTRPQRDEKRRPPPLPGGYPGSEGPENGSQFGSQAAPLSPGLKIPPRGVWKTTKSTQSGPA